MKGPIKQKQDRKNRVRKWRVVGKIYGIKYSLKGHKDRNRHTHTQNEQKKKKKKERKEKRIK